MVPDPPARSYVHPEDDLPYPASDDVGEGGFQHLAIRTLSLLLIEYFASLGRPTLVGGDQFFYYDRDEPRAKVAPDVYTIDDETADLNHVTSWKVWETGKPPTLALEIVSSDYRKDYRPEILERYQRLGVRELIRYDPEHRAPRQCLSHFVRDPSGALVQHPTRPDRVRSACYDFWLVRRPSDQHLVLATGPDGTIPWLTAAERAEQARAAAEAELERLRAELTRLRGG